MSVHIRDVFTPGEIIPSISGKVSQVCDETSKPAIKVNNTEHHCKEMLLTWRAINGQYQEKYRAVSDIILLNQSWSTIRWSVCSNQRHGSSDYALTLSKYYTKLLRNKLIFFMNLPPMIHDQILQWLNEYNLAKSREICLFWHLKWQLYFQNDMWHSIWAMMSSFEGDTTKEQLLKFVECMGYRTLLRWLIFDQRICNVETLKKIRESLPTLPKTKELSDSVKRKNSKLQIDNDILQYITSYLPLSDYLHCSQTCYSVWFMMSNAHWLKKIWQNLKITCKNHAKINPSISSRWWLQFHNNLSLWFLSSVPYTHVFPYWRLNYLTTYCGNVLHVSSNKLCNSKLRVLWWDNIYGNLHDDALHIKNVEQFILTSNVGVHGKLQIDCKRFVCAGGIIRAYFLLQMIKNVQCETIVLWMTRINWSMNNVRQIISRVFCNKNLIYIVDRQIGWQDLIHLATFSSIAQRFRKVTLIFPWNSWNTQSARALLQLLDVHCFANLFEIHILGYFTGEDAATDETCYLSSFNMCIKNTCARIVDRHVNIGVFTINFGISDIAWYSFDLKKCFTDEQVEKHLSNGILVIRFPQISNNQMIWKNLVKSVL